MTRDYVQFVDWIKNINYYIGYGASVDTLIEYINKYIGKNAEVIWGKDNVGRKGLHYHQLFARCGK